ncbi:MAG TPA: metalloregulator ArsR/SmtB family transcription factor [Woeseiaceae bacterium]|nr:metalloregulator ArsR/SmtB family transcription factor [Woeseiaceae bacterium]
MDSGKANAFEDTIRALKAVAEPTRLRLLVLCHRGESTVSELVRVLGQSQPRISRHLKLLCDAGLLERFRDGHFIYYGTPSAGPGAVRVRRLLELLPGEAPELARDAELADAERRASVEPEAAPLTEAERALHRAVLDTVLTAPVGRLLDIGAGSARMLKLLGRRATRAVGVDIDGDQRRQARAQLAVAGMGNCTIRAGDARRLDFADGAFDTVILDEVLGQSSAPEQMLAEAARLLAPGGRLLLIEPLEEGAAEAAGRRIARLAAGCRLAVGRPRPVPAKRPAWLVSVATAARRKVA